MILEISKIYVLSGDYLLTKYAGSEFWAFVGGGSYELCVCLFVVW